MKKELDEQLCKDFPLTFRDRHASMMLTCMCWGFDVQEGWEPLLRKACEKIEPRIQQLIDEGREVDGIQFKASQVKEKFGSARFYFTFSDPTIDAAIKEFEDASEHTCEVCGAEGKLRGKGWLYTACDNCHERRLQDKARDYMFYEVIQELKKQGHLISVGVLEAWREEKKKEKNEQDND